MDCCFSYYFPGVKASGQIAGMEYAFDGAATPGAAVAGPDGKQGFIVNAYRVGSADAERSSMPFGVSKDVNWLACDGGRFWLGVHWDPALRPKPVDLLRPLPKLVDSGYGLKLGDGNEWLIPCAQPVSGSGLPQQYVIEDGVIVSRVMPGFESISSDAERIYDELMRAGRVEMSLDEARDVAARALAVNYRVSVWECVALGLLNEKTIYPVLYALIDLPARNLEEEVRAAQKKTETPAEGAESGTARGG